MASVRKRSIRFKLAIGMVAFLVPTYMLIGFIFVRDISDRKTMIGVHHMQTAQALAVAVRAFIDSQVAVMQTVATHLSGLEGTDDEVSEELREVLELSSSVGSVGLFGADGKLIGSDPPGTPRQRLEPSASLRKDITEGSSFKVSDIRDAAGEQGFLVVVPMRSDDGKLRYLSAWIEDDSLTAFLTLRIGTTGNIGVLDSRGMAVLLSFVPGISWEHRDRSFIPSVRAALKGQASMNTGFVDPIDGVKRIGGSAPIRELGWVANVFEPEAEALADQQATILVDIVVLAIISIFTALVLRSAARKMVIPIESMAQASKRIEQGEFSSRVDITTGDELETLARSFNEMAAKIQGVLKSERRVADMVRDSLLPSQFDRVPWLDIGVAKGTASEQYGVGGDFYGLALMSGDRLGFVLGDVTGKGVEAAASAVRAKYLAESLLAQSRSPVEIIWAINEDICKRTPELEAASPRYMTVMVGVFERDARRFIWANAGHPPPLSCAADDCRYLEKGGLLAGFEHRISIEEHSIPFMPGDKLLVVTDGVHEAKRTQGGRTKLFGEDRTMERFIEYRGADAQETADSIFDDVKDYTGGVLTDDTVAMVFRMPEWLAE